VEAEYLHTTIDKFVFKAKTGYWYSESGLWVRLEDSLARVGVSDYVQQSSGDVAFVEIQPAGTEVGQEGYLGTIETIKVAIDLFSPVCGTVQEVNKELEASPELINQDPYGQGWLALIALTGWEADRANLLAAEQYLAVVRSQAEEAAKRR
jgi:glycine cleavage system H protein